MSHSQSQLNPICVKPRKKRKHKLSVQDCLAAKYKLNSLNNNNIEKCYNEIIKSLDNNKKDIILMLMKSSNFCQYENMMEILNNALNENDEKQQENQSYFDYLPIESIYNICDFLNKSDLTNLKMVSISMALIIFDIMKCHKINVFDMNEIIERSPYKTEAKLNIKNKLKIQRIQPFTNYNSLSDIYCTRYNISFENMLILESDIDAINTNKRLSFDDFKRLCLLSEYQRIRGRILKNTVNEKVTNKISLYIFDKTKIVSLLTNGHSNISKPIILSEIPEKQFLDENCYNLSLLQYFDRDKQQIQNVQFLLFDKNTTYKQIENYICNDLESFINKMYRNHKNVSLSWCDNLISTLNKMKQFESNDTKSKHHHHELINIYNSTLKRNDRRINTVEYTKYINIPENVECDFKVITFEINDNHPQDPFFNIHHDQNTLSHPIFSNLCEYTDDQSAKFNIICCNTDKNLKDQIKYFDAQYVLNDDNISEIKLSVTPNTTFRMIQNKLSLKLQNKVPAKHIQIHSKIENETTFENKTINNNHGCSTLNWSIVPYNTLCTDRVPLQQISVYQFVKNETDLEFEELVFRFPPDPMSQFYIKHNFDEKKQEMEIERDNDNNLGTRSYKFEPHQSNQQKKMLYYQNICSENNVYSNISFEELKFEDVYQDNSKSNDMVIKVDGFMQIMFNILSHPMYSDQYKPIIDKYHDKDKYSFLINIGDKYYDNNDHFIQNTANSGMFNINVLIVNNMKNILKDLYYDDNKTNASEHYPLIIRFGLNQNFGDGKIKHFGYPKKVWITKQMTIKQMLDKYFNEINKFEFLSCKSRNGDLEINDNIYDKTHGQTQLLIQLKMEKPGSKPPKPPQSMPQRPLSPYTIFSNERECILKQQYPEKKIEEITKLIADEWRAQSSEECEIYQIKAKIVKQKYIEDINEYKKTDEFKQYKQRVKEWQTDRKRWDYLRYHIADYDDIDCNDYNDDNETLLQLSFPRKPRDANCPKRPLTAYFLFAKDVREQIKSEFSNCTMTEIAKEIGRKWEWLSDDEKKPYKDKAARLSEEYKIEFAKYKGSDAQIAYLQKLDKWKEDCDKIKQELDNNAEENIDENYVLNLCNLD